MSISQHYLYGTLMSPATMQIVCKSF